MSNNLDLQLKRVGLANKPAILAHGTEIQRKKRAKRYASTTRKRALRNWR